MICTCSTIALKALTVIVQYDHGEGSGVHIDSIVRRAQNHIEALILLHNGVSQETEISALDKR